MDITIDMIISAAALISLAFLRYRYRVSLVVGVLVPFRTSTHLDSVVLRGVSFRTL